nr:MAG TPA: YopX protein [Caudoviricetes sp.]
MRMREIKFRAWVKDRKAIFEVISIDYVSKKVTYIVERTGHLLNIRHDKFNDVELMQYTGIKDKDNKKIYEGDILFESFGEKYYKVIFENGGFRAEFEGDFDEYSFDLIDVVAQGCEIVGNIYENSELIKEVR